ncbi:MAG: excinuclease ABC subunit UvrB [Bacilli bacterium]|nr:excinuclease ABC subunit UvrB [Bacilli bacterium]MDD3305166.1 excinuclease ABC subunit UvrB [Bacilli bacterium]MDD4053991.1 excinuclease ABC subunit UvrB [Bacilli bacterium]MDD4411728.1 excinuclease ABC subunit UvrB [Bacilli bacterium]
MSFNLVSQYKPSGDQPKAIKELTDGIKANKKHQVLLGATGTGKTFTISNVINNVNKPVLVLAHNKTLAGQLYSEFKELFPNNRVEYFVSYYDYYQPEAYVPSTDTFIEKDASINDEIDELRHSATSALLSRKDVIVVASVSCIYGIGEVEDYKNKMLILNVGDNKKRDNVLKRLVEMLYERNNLDLKRGTFRAKGDVIELVPSYEHSKGIRIEFFGDEIERISEFDILTGVIINDKKSVSIYPASHFVTDEEKLKISIDRIKSELATRLEYFKDNNKYLEHQRLMERTNYDIEMLEETGFCRGVENYARHLALKKEGETPTTLIDFFPKDFLLIVDESHATLPQVRGMFNGDRARKTVLVDYGFRLPSAVDNRPLRFEEFEKKINQVIYLSATPGDYEMDKVDNYFTEQIIRPTGLLDPTIEVRKTEGQIDNIVGEINTCIKKSERVIITTLTIRMAEELTNYLKNLDIKVAYLHNEVKTLERVKIIRDLRLGKYDVLVGINLLREGLDIPEVSLIAILDADKQGFLRSHRSLIQIIGRCARNVNGKVIMYADKISDAMSVAINETDRRRNIQDEYNKKHGIIPATINKDIRELISNEIESDKSISKSYSKKKKERIIKQIEEEMQEAAKNLNFERATELRDILFELKVEGS